MLTAPDADNLATTGSALALPHTVTIRFEATELSVRQTLSELQDLLQQRGLADDDLGKMEIVLAEALNNVVEHAYADTGIGQITLTCKLAPTRLDLTILDQGVPVPVHVFAKRTAPRTDVPLEDLPEGGFGWMLIQQMTTSLSYQRVSDTNCLRMTIPLDTPAP